jgi:hypothetical protein
VAENNHDNETLLDVACGPYNCCWILGPLPSFMVL